MFKRILIISLALSMLTACASGVRPTAAVLSQSTQITLDQSTMQKYATQLPQPADGKQSTLLQNHVLSAQLYHQCAIDHNALIDGIYSQRGIVINGIDHAIDSAKPRNAAPAQFTGPP